MSTMEHPVACENDLVFTILGGHRHGMQIYVRARKSILALGDGQGDSRNEQNLCAIYRGPAGTVIRNLEDEILVNNQPKSTHWLEAGDLIQFANSVTLQVTQLGIIQEEDETDSPIEYRTHEEQKSNGENSPDVDVKPFNLQSINESPQSGEDSSSENYQAESQFDVLSKRIDELAEQISGLVELASTGQFPTTSGAETDSQIHFPTNQDHNQEAFCPADMFPTNETATQFESDSIEPKTSYLESLDGQSFSEQFNPSRFVQEDETECIEGLATKIIAEPPIAEESKGVTEGNPRTDEALDELLKRLFNETSSGSEAPGLLDNPPSTEEPMPEERSSFFDPSDLSSVTSWHDQEQLETKSGERSDYQTDREVLEASGSDLIDSFDQSQADVLSETESEIQIESQPEYDPKKDQETSESESVEEYMNQLLARMNFGNSTSCSTSKNNPLQSKKLDTEINDKDETEAVEHKFMKPEEYVPKRKAEKIESLATMRDIANTTARSAVAYSDYSRKKTRCLMQLIISVGAAIMAIYYFVGVMKSVGDIAFWIGSFCFLISGVLCFMSFKTLSKQKSVFEYMFQTTEQDARPNPQDDPMSIRS